VRSAPGLGKMWREGLSRDAEKSEKGEEGGGVNSPGPRIVRVQR
jgi:hypothetical protein